MYMLHIHKKKLAIWTDVSESSWCHCQVSPLTANPSVLLGANAKFIIHDACNTADPNKNMNNY